MPTWNAEPFLAEAVESVLAQTFKNFELLIIDGASTDRTLEILSRYTDARLRIVQAPAPGILTALNFGIEQARGTWIARQDADDISHPSRFEIQLHALNRENAIFSHTDYELIGEGSNTMGRSWFARTQAFLALRLCFMCGIVHSSVMFKKESALAVGGYQEKQAEDFALWGKFVEAGRCIGVPQKLLKFRVHPVSASNRHREMMQTIAQKIAIGHCERFMQLPREEAIRAYEVLVNRKRGRRDWLWLLSHCVPRLKWKSAEMYAWLGLQTLKTFART
jgi:glycosyltransferase involved in cell wall biosynthesis